MRVRCLPLYCHLLYLLAFVILSFINIVTLIACNSDIKNNQLHTNALPFAALFTADVRHTADTRAKDDESVSNTPTKTAFKDDLGLKDEEQLLLQIDEEEKELEIPRASVQHSATKSLAASMERTREDSSQFRRRSSRKEPKSSHSRKKHKRKEKEKDLELATAEAGVSVADLSDSILRYLPSDTDKEISQALKSLSNEEKEQDKAAVQPPPVVKEELRRQKKPRKKKKKVRLEEEEEDIGSLGVEIFEANSVDKLFGSLLEKIDEELQNNEKAVEEEDFYGEGETETEGASNTNTLESTRSEHKSIEMAKKQSYAVRRHNGTLEISLQPQLL